MIYYILEESVNLWVTKEYGINIFGFIGWKLFFHKIDCEFYFLYSYFGKDLLAQLV